MMASNLYLMNLEAHGDERGQLISLENRRNIPFEIKRVYYIFDTQPEWTRGHHAHPHLEQVIIAIDGACRFVLDDGQAQQEIWLNRPDRALFIGKNIWREMHDFSYGCKLLVLANDYYNPEEYIKDYHTFLRMVHIKKG